MQLPLHSTTLRNVVEVSHVVLREQKTGATGTRPGVLKDPEPQLLDAVLACSAGWGAVGGHAVACGTGG